MILAPAMGCFIISASVFNENLLFFYSLGSGSKNVRHMAGVAAGRFMKNLRRCSAYAPNVGKFDDHMIEFNYFPQQWFLPASRL